MNQEVVAVDHDGGHWESINPGVEERVGLHSKVWSLKDPQAAHFRQVWVGCRISLAGADACEE